MWDNCHPTLDGYVIISQGIARALQDVLGYRISLKPFVRQEFEAAFQFDAELKAKVLTWSGRYCYSSSTLVWDPTQRLQRAQEYLEMAATIVPEHPRILFSLGVVAALRGDTAKAVEWWRYAAQIDPKMVRESLDNPHMKQVLHRVGLTDLTL
jgi:tetratricopeptide (TPR) repeat protein